VDDNSDTSCADVIEVFVNKGLAVSLVESKERLYAKNARLLGVEKARADIIAFADADDVYYGTETLERHVDMFRANQVDLLQFRGVYLDQEGRYAAMNHNQPLGERLAGKDIFRAYLTCPVFGIWTHLYSRRKWLRLISDLWALPIKVLEEACMLLLYYYHAESYIGSMEIGYGYMRDISRQRSFSRQSNETLAYRIMLKNLPAYLRDYGEEGEIVEKLCMFLLQHLRLCAGRASIAYARAPEDLSSLPDADIPVFMECVADCLSANAAKLRTINRTILRLPNERWK